MKCGLRVATLLLCLSLVGCNQAGREAVSPVQRAGTPDGDAFDVRAVADTVVWRDHQSYRSFEIAVRVHNRASRPLYKHWCEATIQRRIANAWADVQHALCLGAPYEYMLVAPDDSAEQLVRVYRYPDTNHPMGDARLTAGTYRVVLVVGFEYDVRNGLEVTALPDARATQAFAVKDPVARTP